MNLTLDLGSDSPSEMESLRDFMYSDLNPILDRYKVNSEKTLRRIMATHLIPFLMQNDPEILESATTSSPQNPELITGNVVVDNWKNYTYLFDNIVILKCSKTRMSNLGQNYKYCFYDKDELLQENAHLLETRAREKYNIPEHKTPTVSQLLNSITNDVLPVRQTARPHMSQKVNPFATRKPSNAPRFGETNVLPGSISYESINSPNDFSKSLSASNSKRMTKKANSSSKSHSKRMSLRRIRKIRIPKIVYQKKP